MNEKTILEFAKDLGVTKKQVENKLAKLKKEGIFLGTLKGGKRYLNFDEQKHLRELMDEGVEAPGSKPPKSTFKVPNESVNELKIYIEQNKQYEKQIENLTRLLENQQKLTAGILSEKNKLQLELEEERSLGFWSRLFKRKRKDENN